MSLDLIDSGRLKTALCFVQAYPDRFRPGFEEWLAGNAHIWFEFEKRADALYRKGWRHFGAKAIWESIRYETALRDTRETSMRLNNSWVSSLSRLWICHHPERDGFFEMRHREAA